jgi:protein-S-isoprenylcysteine O-methyltransferase Ste14
MVESKSKSWKSYLFVFLQFLSLGLIAITGPLIADSFMLLIVELFGLFLGFWAIFSMEFGNFNIVPDPVKGARLVMRGPYQWIRHPMYLALLLTTLPLILESWSPIRMVYWSILLINLLLKINYEEQLLVTNLDGYQNYLDRSARLIPFIY